MPRAEKFGDLMTANHKVFNVEGESRNNHRCAVVVQDLAHSMDSISPAQNKNFSGDGPAVAKAEVIYTDNSLEFGKSCEKIHHGIIVLQYSIYPRRMVSLKERYAEYKKGRLLLQSGLDEKWWVDSI